MIEKGKISGNRRIKGDYYRIDLHAPGISGDSRPGQFVHVLVPGLFHKVLRRPFSICNADPETGILTVVYKIVGEGTEMLATRKKGTACDMMGPMGVPFTVPLQDEFPVIVAGGYGAAATYLLSRKCPRPGIFLLGARSSADLIMVGEFKKLGFDVRTATEDGSNGHRGLVTDLLEKAMREGSGKKMRFYGCGPHGMLMAMGRMLLSAGLDGELSLDHKMCCGLGACFACVVKIKDAADPSGWYYARTCSEGPVFKASQIYYE